MNLTKKLLQLLLCAALIFGLCSTVALAETPTVTLSSPEGALKVGDTFTVNVDMANNTGFAAVQWRLEYNSSALELTNILTETNDSTFIFGAMACETATEYRKATDALNLNISASTGKINTKYGTLCQLVFKVKDGAQDGTGQNATDGVGQGATDGAQDVILSGGGEAAAVEGSPMAPTDGFRLAPHGILRLAPLAQDDNPRAEPT